MYELETLKYEELAAKRKDVVKQQVEIANRIEILEERVAMSGDEPKTNALSLIFGGDATKAAQTCAQMKIEVEQLQEERDTAAHALVLIDSEIAQRHEEEKAAEIAALKKEYHSAVEDYIKELVSAARFQVDVQEVFEKLRSLTGGMANPAGLEPMWSPAFNLSLRGESEPLVRLIRRAVELGYLDANDDSLLCIPLRAS